MANATQTLNCLYIMIMLTLLIQLKKIDFAFWLLELGAQSWSYCNICIYLMSAHLIWNYVQLVTTWYEYDMTERFMVDEK